MTQAPMWTVRGLVTADERLTYAWRVDRETCAASVDQAAPTPAEHRAWLAERLAGKGPMTFIVSRDGRPVGMFTFIADIGERRISIGYMVAPQDRGLHYAGVIRLKALQCIRDRFPFPMCLVSKIRKDNVASLIVAMRGGSRLVSVDGDFARLEAMVR